MPIPRTRPGLGHGVPGSANHVVALQERFKNCCQTDMQWRPALVTFLVIAAIAGSFAWFLRADEARATAWAGEDGPIEWFGAVAVFAGACLLVLSYFRDATGTRRLERLKAQYARLLLAALFVFVAGEEISWGQRIFGFATPPSLHEVNAQGEMNVHNLWIFHHDPSRRQKSTWEMYLTADLLFANFWAIYFVVVPMAARFSARVAAWLRRARVPVVHPVVGAAFVALTIAGETAAPALSEPMQRGLLELRESAAELLLCLAAYLISLESCAVETRVANRERALHADAGRDDSVGGSW